jgi:phospholipase/carboxylesterase
MNRIQHLATGSGLPVADYRPAVVESGCFERSQHDAPFALFSPLHYERNYAYPLIVWLHGPDDDERQLKRVMPLVSMRNYVAVAPRGTVSADDLAANTDDLPECGFAWSQAYDHILLAEHIVFAALQAARRKFNVAESRVFVAGFACGGTMAMRLALNHPTVFAGAASFSGSFPSGHTPLSQLSDARKLKLLLATGRDSVEYPPTNVCQHLRLFHVAGMSVCLRQYPCGDDLTTSMLSDMDRWIMDQIIAPTADAADEAPTRGRSQ